MSKLVRICSRNELPDKGLAREFSAGGKTLCIANVDGVICALENECPHRGGPLAEGTVEGGMVVCPWHGWAFDPGTGRAVHDPHEGVAVYRVIIMENDVVAEME